MTATGFFKALCQIREVLALEGLYPHCHGSSLNVYAIGSSPQVHDGLRAYRLSMGREVTTQFDIVEIFDCCEASVLPVTVTEQCDYWQWLQSTA
ncbi:hypothetical protein [Cupriavidus sp. 8B]